jgi:hypothetical protein
VDEQLQLHTPLKGLDVACDPLNAQLHSVLQAIGNAWQCSVQHGVSAKQTHELVRTIIQNRLRSLRIAGDTITAIGKLWPIIRLLMEWVDDLSKPSVPYQDGSAPPAFREVKLNPLSAFVPTCIIACSTVTRILMTPALLTNPLVNSLKLEP